MSASGSTSIERPSVQFDWSSSNGAKIMATSVFESSNNSPIMSEASSVGILNYKHSSTSSSSGIK